MKRLVQPEILDTLPPGDPRAIGSRRDLHRINWWMRNHAIMAGALQSHLPRAPKKITELGAGDGKFLLRVAKKTAPRWLGVQATLLDLQKNVSAETLAALVKLGWRPETVVADVFNWPSANAGDEVVIANLFLHHFEDARLAELLGNISQRTKLFVAVEPYRFALPELVGRMLWFMGCNEVTRHDAAVSVRAGFEGREISALWPDHKNWKLTERRVGLFSHVFIAQRLE